MILLLVDAVANSVALSIMLSFAIGRTTVLQGVVLLVIFAIYSVYDDCSVAVELSKNFYLRFDDSAEINK